MQDSQKTIQLLEEKLKKYEEILSKVLDEPKIIGHIEAGPIIDQDTMVYRVKTEGGRSIIAAFSEEYMFKEEAKAGLEEGTEVILVKGLIVSTMPNVFLLQEELPDFGLISWDDIGGLKNQLDTIREAIELPLQNAKLAKEIGVTPVKGMLLYGPPGCGKTMVAKAIASTILKGKNVEKGAFTYVKGGSLLSKYVGETEQRIVSMFKRSREYSKKTGKRAVIFIDEAEAIMPTRGSRVSSDVESTIVPTFLAEMDGLAEDTPFVLLATNFKDKLDSAITREGRIDIKVEVGRPNKEDFTEIVLKQLGKVKCADNALELAEVASESIYANPAMSNRVSGALAATLVNSSAQKALKRKIADKSCKTGVVREDVMAAITMLN